MQSPEHTPKKRKRGHLICGKEACGSTNAWPQLCEVWAGRPVHLGDFLCSACRRRPQERQDGEPLFTHLANDNVILAAAEYWKRVSGTTEAPPAVVAGWVPNKECLCQDSDCFNFNFRRERRKELKAATMCAAP